jgi:hypothetical protein
MKNLIYLVPHRRDPRRFVRTFQVGHEQILGIQFIQRDALVNQGKTQPRAPKKESPREVLSK